MSYIVRASWHWGELIDHGCNTLKEATALASRQLKVMTDWEQGTGVTITKDGEVIREYKVGDE